jgi:pimeloyl-ACP methyl ester carboxylesterase
LYTDPNNSKSVFWPDLVRTDQRLGSPAIYLAGYYTKSDAGDYPIAQCAKEVMDALQLPERDGTPAVLDANAVVFVCHSMGGIMARYLIERHQAVFRRKAVGLALIASPSLGSEWANVAGFAARYYNQHLAQQLEWKGDSLSELHGRFKDLVDNRATEMPGLFGMEAAETEMIYRDSLPGLIERWILPNRLQIVSSLSAGQYFGEVRSLPGTNHFSIVKPYGFSHPAHEFLVTFMRRFQEKLIPLQRDGLIGRPATVTASAALAGGQTLQQIPIEQPRPASGAGTIGLST